MVYVIINVIIINLINRNSKEIVPQVNPSSSLPIAGLARHRYWSTGKPQVQLSSTSFVEKKRNSYFQKFENLTQSLN